MLSTKKFAFFFFLIKQPQERKNPLFYAVDDEAPIVAADDAAGAVVAAAMPVVTAVAKLLPLVVVSAADDEAAADLVGHAAELGGDEVAFVGNDFVIYLKGRREPLAQEGKAGLAGFVGIDAGGGAVGDVEDADFGESHGGFLTTDYADEHG